MSSIDTVVLKFGGASVAKLEGFDAICHHIIAAKEAGCRVVVVVSAMQGTTDQLLAMAHRVNANPPQRECDMLVTVGERISCALLSMTLAKFGVVAPSFTGSQAGIITCERHADARILDVNPFRLMPHLERSGVIVVAGFQGVSRSGNITTLGRNGSDTTAVALGAALKAKEVAFYKGAPGIYDANPKVDERARHVPELTYDEALLLAERSGHFLHPRCIALAKRNGIPLQFRSFEESSSCSWIRDDTVIPGERVPLFELAED